MFDSCMVARTNLENSVAEENCSRAFFSFWAKSVAQVEKRLVSAKKKKQKDKDVHTPL